MKRAGCVVPAVAVVAVLLVSSLPMVSGRTGSGADVPMDGPVHNLDLDTWYPTIQQAVDAANPGNRIHATAGNYNEVVRIQKALTLFGDGAGLTYVTKEIYVANINAVITIEKLHAKSIGADYSVFPIYENVTLNVNDCEADLSIYYSHCWGYGHLNINRCTMGGCMVHGGYGMISESHIDGEIYMPHPITVSTVNTSFESYVRDLNDFDVKSYARIKTFSGEKPVSSWFEIYDAYGTLKGTYSTGSDGISDPILLPILSVTVHEWTYVTTWLNYTPYNVVVHPAGGGTFEYSLDHVRHVFPMETFEIPLHDVRINSDADFDAEHYVFRGTGTESDPYVIENLAVSGVNGCGFFIGNTTKHFVVQDCHFFDAMPSAISYYMGTGLYIHNSRNYSIERNRFSNNSRGAYLDLSPNGVVVQNGFNCSGISGSLDLNIINSQNTRVDSNWFSTDSTAISLLSDNIFVQNNTIFANRGISLMNSRAGTRIIDNRMQGNGFSGEGLYYSGTTINNGGNRFERNCIENFYYGIRIFGRLERSQIISNTVQGNSYAMHMTTYLVDMYKPWHNMIYNNVFIDSPLGHIYQSRVMTNFWNASYPTGGNYYSGFSAPDAFSGPGQDVPGSDNIADDPYVIVNDNDDMYPLLVLPSQRGLVADAGTDQVAEAGETVTFDGTGSFTPLGTEAFEWSFVHDGVPVVLSGSSPSFVFDIAGNYTVTLTVTNILGENSTDLVVIRVGLSSVPLHLGWNLISINIMAPDYSFSDILAPIEGGYDMVQTYDESAQVWRVHSPSAPPWLDTLSEFDLTHGFWIHITSSSADCLPFFNSAVATETNITLKKGWNLVGLPSTADGKVGTLLTGLPWDLVQGYDGASPYLLSDMDTNDWLVPGNGYWVHVTEECVWQVQP